LEVNEDIRRDRIQKLAVIHTERRSLFLSVAPIFTRGVIQDLSQQLRDLEGRCGTVSKAN
jgi:hypothetical protein